MAALILVVTLFTLFTLSPSALFQSGTLEKFCGETSCVETFRAGLCAQQSRTLITEPAEYNNARRKEKRRSSRRVGKTLVFSMCWQQEID